MVRVVIVGSGCRGSSCDDEVEVLVTLVDEGGVCIESDGLGGWWTSTGELGWWLNVLKIVIVVVLVVGLAGWWRGWWFWQPESGNNPPSRYALPGLRGAT